MKLYYKLFGWGCGYFTTHAGEHLNKKIKQFEATSTDFDENRFCDIIHAFRARQFRFPESFNSEKRDIRCSACPPQGHNKKNKSCPLHPSHPTLEFDDSDEENV